MTDLLEKAFREACTLPEDEQDEPGRRLLQELEWERKWDTAFADNPPGLEVILRQAEDDIAAGRTSERLPGDE